MVSVNLEFPGCLPLLLVPYQTGCTLLGGIDTEQGVYLFVRLLPKRARHRTALLIVIHSAPRLSSISATDRSPPSKTTNINASSAIERVRAILVAKVCCEVSLCNFSGKYRAQTGIWRAYTTFVSVRTIKDHHLPV